VEAAVYGFGIVVVVLAAWIYFDAWDRGYRYPWLWGLGFLIGGPVGVVVFIGYVATRKARPHLEVAPGSALRLYLVVTSLTALALAVDGASNGFFMALKVATGQSSVGYRNWMAASLSAAIVGGVIWWVHWRATTRYVGSLEDDTTFRAMYRLRRIGILTAGFLFGGITAAAALGFFTMAVGAVVHASWGAASRWVPLIGPLVAAGAAAAFHGLAFRRELHGAADERWRALPAPPMVHALAVRAPARPVPAWSSGGVEAPSHAAAPMAAPADDGGRTGGGAPGAVPVPAPTAVGSSATGWWLASDGHWYPPPSPVAASAESAPAADPEEVPAASAESAPAAAASEADEPAEAQTAAAGAVGLEPEARRPSCQSCGEVSGPGDRFCRSCGAALEPPAPSGGPSESPVLAVPG